MIICQALPTRQISRNTAKKLTDKLVDKGIKNCKIVSVDCRGRSGNWGVKLKFKNTLSLNK